MTSPTLTLTRSIVVEAAPGTLYQLCEGAEALPALLRDVDSVERIGERTHRWKAGRGESRLAWETEAVQADPPHRIGWRARGEDLEEGFEGEVQFQALPGGGTEVRLILSCVSLPGASLIEAERVVDENLASFKAAAEERSAASSRPEAALDAQRAASMADEGGEAAARVAGGTSVSTGKR
jgi:uncharacterized membrane protein